MRHSSRRLVYIFGLLIVAAALVFALKGSTVGVYLKTLGNDQFSMIRVDGQPVAAEIVADKESQVKGLSGRSALPSDHGMLFVFDRDNYYAMWMKGMRFSIDVLWVAENGTVVDIRENLAPDSYPQIFRPTEPVRYILELPAGFVAEHGVVVGDQVSI